MESQDYSSVDPHIVKENDGWYFWDEVGQNQYGPYKSKQEAREKLLKYDKEVLGD